MCSHTVYICLQVTHHLITPADLMHQNGATEPSPSCQFPLTGEGSVLPHNHHLYLHALSFGPLEGYAKIESVSCVVFDYHQGPCWALDGSESCINGGRRRRGKDGSSHGSCQHGLPDEPSMCWLMATASTRQQSDLEGRMEAVRLERERESERREVC